MPRFKATIEYDGGPYKGFQLQATHPSVQGALETAIKGFSGEAVRVAAAGRTDTGVHALEQVIHFDLARDWKTDVVRDAMNAHLVREGVSVLAVEQVTEEFHARFSAIGRRYLFRILDRKAPPAIERGRVWWLKHGLDAAAMHGAGQVLVGLHDFTTFRDANCQAASPVKTLDSVRVTRVGEEVHLAFAARSFLHRQVRSMTGALAEVGQGRWSAADLKAALEAKDRAACAQVAPPQGLYLSGVVYPTGGTPNAEETT